MFSNEFTDSMSIEIVVDGRNTGKKENDFRTGMSETGIWDW
jgi:hypothetical protein